MARENFVANMFRGVRNADTGFGRAARKGLLVAAPLVGLGTAAAGCASQGEQLYDNQHNPIGYKDPNGVTHMYGTPGATSDGGFQTSGATKVDATQAQTGVGKDGIPVNIAQHSKLHVEAGHTYVIGGDVDVTVNGKSVVVHDTIQQTGEIVVVRGVAGEDIEIVATFGASGIDYAPGTNAAVIGNQVNTMHDEMVASGCDTAGQGCYGGVEVDYVGLNK